MNVLLIAVFGALGAVSRYALNGLIVRCCGDAFPLGILLINVAGCFLLGVVAQISQSTDLLSPNARSALAVGFLGAFTTFSTFGLDTFRQLESAAWWAATANVLGNVVLGLIGVWLGISVAKLLCGTGA